MKKAKLTLSFSARKSILKMASIKQQAPALKNRKFQQLFATTLDFMKP